MRARAIAGTVKEDALWRQRATIIIKIRIATIRKEIVPRALSGAMIASDERIMALRG